MFLMIIQGEKIRTQTISKARRLLKWTLTISTLSPQRSGWKIFQSY